MTRKLLTLLLALSMLVCVLSGCGGTAEPVASEAATPEESAPAEPAPVESAPAEPAPVEESAEPEPEPDPNEGMVAGDTGYDWSVFQPVSEERITLSMFYTQPPMLSAIVDVPSDKSFVYQQLEKLTNVEIEFTMINMMNAATDFALMMAAGDMCDIVNDAVRYYGSPDQAFDEGACLDLYDYEQYIPHFMAVMNEYPQIPEDLTTDEGHLVNFPNITYPFEKVAAAGLVIRKDWVDALGFEMPVSFDEYHDVLAGFKSEYGISDPYIMPYNVLSPWGMFAGGFGLALTDGANNFYLEDGKPALATVSDGYYDFLTMFSSWYQEGLIGSDFMSFMENVPNEALISDGQTGLWFSDTPYIKTYETLMANADPSCVLDLAAEPARDRDYTGYIITDDSASVSNGGFSVSDNCENPEIAMAWCDYWYDPALLQFINYGFQGETFEYDENGEPQLSGLITNNEYELTTRLANGLFLCTSGGFFNMTKKFNNDYTDLQKKAETAWDYEVKDPSKSNTEGLPSGFSLNADRSAEVTVLMADIITFVTESALKFVVGEIPLTEESYQEYRDNINNMKLDKVYEILDEAYAEYLGK